MKQTLLYFAAACSLLSATLSFTGCDDDDSKKGGAPAPVLKIDDTEVSVPAEGGDARVSYTLENPVKGVLPEASSDQTWVHDFDAAEGILSFRTDANSGTEAREARVEVSYDGKVRGSFLVKQDFVPPLPAEGFDIEIREKTYTGVTYDVYPADKEMTWIDMVQSKRDLETYYTSDEEIFQDDLVLLSMQAQTFGLSLEDYLKQTLKKGVRKDIFLDGLAAGTEYVVYTYGLNASGERLTDIFKKEFATPVPEKNDMTFEITFSQVEDIYYQMSVKPSDDEHRYYFDLVEEELLTETGMTIEEFVNQSIAEQIAFGTANGMTKEEVLEQLCSNGPDSYEYEIYPGVSFLGFACSINDDGVVDSEVATERISIQ